jgi:hypothetical protein
MDGYSIFGFIVFMAAVFLATLSSDPIEDIHTYVAAIALLLLIGIAQRANQEKVK